MAGTARARHRGIRDARHISRVIADELREARMAAGLSQRGLARRAGMSQSRVSRSEAASPDPAEWLEGLAVHCAALGLRLSIKMYPVGSPVRDAAHLRLLARFHARIDRAWRWQPEAPVSGYRDLRAWDIRLDGPGAVGVEAETRLRDIQAMQRRCETKFRDGSIDRLVLLVAKTRHNQLILRDHRETLRPLFPADTREVLAALVAGELPRRNGIVIV